MMTTPKAALIDLIGVLLRANTEGGLWLALSNEGITDAYTQSVTSGLQTIGTNGIAEIERRYDVKVPQDYLAETTSNDDKAPSEEQIAALILARIESGDLSLKDIAVRLARYGLMDPAEFIDEMRERMDSAN